jgi:hypothetical protein
VFGRKTNFDRQGNFGNFQKVKNVILLFYFADEMKTDFAKLQ